jgi:hypothetical protein
MNKALPAEGRRRIAGQCPLNRGHVLAVWYAQIDVHRLHDLIHYILINF